MKLPSTKAAEEFLAGEGVGGVIRTTLTRGAVIAAAGYAAGARGQPLIRTAAAGAVAIELLVLAYAFMSKPKTNTR